MTFNYLKTHGLTKRIYKAYAALKEEDKGLRNAIIEVRNELLESNHSLVDIIDESVNKNVIADYWTGHTVHDDWFISKEESVTYCESRFNMYPCFKEMAEMERPHDGEVLLDYGCGPGNDLAWYASNNDVKQIIGMDVSISALQNARLRMGLHKIPPEKVSLYCINENSERIPLEDCSVDFISCQGCLMHTSNPDTILQEFYRVVKGNRKETSDVCIMVYNKDSIWYHLYVAYYLKYINCDNPSPLDKEVIKNMDINEIFRRSTDGVDCPRAMCWTSEEVTEMCHNAGFGHVEYKGGYPNNLEPGLAKKYIMKALKDPRLEEEHKAFLREVTFNENGYPMYKGKLCCIGGVYHLWKYKSE